MSLAAAAPAAGATITVNTTADNIDAGGDCTLREAIIVANGGGGGTGCAAASDGSDTIVFALGGSRTISPATQLPPISQPAIVDGNTDGTRVTLDGSGTVAGDAGLRLTGGATSVRGLVVTGFGGDGIDVTSAANVIGGSSEPGRTIISGNGGHGIDIEGADANGNLVLGNYIGTDLSGTAAAGNALSGIRVGAGSRTLIFGNLVSANQTGITVTGGAAETTIRGNVVGLGAAGAALGNSPGSGISLAGSTRSVVGGDTAVSRNVVSANGGSGISVADGTGDRILGNFVGTDGTGSLDRGNAGNGVLLGAAAKDTIVGDVRAGGRNVISGNALNGVLIAGPGATANSVHGNLIGLDAAGLEAVGNDLNGVLLQGAGTAANAIGAATTGGGNVISGNGRSGIGIDGPASGNEVLGNRIGTDLSGTLPRLNGLVGVFVSGSQNTIGGDTPEAENLIATGGAHAIEIFSDGADGNVVARNRGSASGTLFLDLGPPGDIGNSVATGANAGAQAPAIALAGASFLRGTAPAGSTIRAFRTDTAAGGGPEDISSFVGSATADASGSWRVDYPEALPDGARVTAGQTTAGGSSEYAVAAVTDASPPETTIATGPADGSTGVAASQTFGFTSEAGATFECSLDGAAFSSCASPVTVGPLAPGAHSFSVRAIDASSNVDPTPATRTFSVTSGDGGGPGGGGGAPGEPPVTSPEPDRIAPVVRRFTSKNRIFRVGRLPTPLAAARRPRGTTFRFVLSEPANVRIGIQRRLRGRKVGGRCRAATRARRKNPRCVRFKRKGALRRAGVQGRNRVRFSGRMGRKRLRRGRYRATLVARDGARNRSRRSRTSFRIAG